MEIHLNNLLYNRLICAGSSMVEHKFAILETTDRNRFGAPKAIGLAHLKGSCAAPALYAPCGCRIMAIITAFQAVDEGSIPSTRSISPG